MDIAGPRQTVDGVTDKDFAGGGRRANASGNVDRRAHIALFCLGCLAGVNTDCRVNRQRGMSLGFRSSSGDDRNATANRRRGRWEHHVEAVALGLDLGAVIRGNRATDQPAVGIEQPARGAVTVRLGERRVAAEIAE